MNEYEMINKGDAFITSSKSQFHWQSMYEQFFFSSHYFIFIIVEKTMLKL